MLEGVRVSGLGFRGPQLMLAESSCIFGLPELLVDADTLVLLFPHGGRTALIFCSCNSASRSAVILCRLAASIKPEIQRRLQGAPTSISTLHHGSTCKHWHLLQGQGDILGSSSDLQAQSLRGRRRLLGLLGAWGGWGVVLTSEPS